MCDVKDNNFSVMIKDLKVINAFIRWKFRDKKVFLLGHSMGAYVSLKYSEVYGDSIDGLIISGIGKGNNLNIYGPYVTSKLMCGFLDASKPSKFISGSFYRVLNRSFKNDENFDNLSFTTSNEEVINNYNNDDLRIKTYTLKFYHDLFDGIKSALSSESLDRIPKTLKILHLTGALDPVCSFTRGSKKLYKELIKRGLDVKNVIYEDTRHEVFVEDKKYDAFNEVLEFITKNS